MPDDEAVQYARRSVLCQVTPVAPDGKLRER
jgi:hypothetical protein